MEQFLRKFQNSGKITWTRVKRSNGKYGYVRTKNERPIDFDEYTGKFKMYD
jgi:ribosomal protein L35AE/L33A